MEGRWNRIYRPHTLQTEKLKDQGQRVAERRRHRFVLPSFRSQFLCFMMIVISVAHALVLPRSHSCDAAEYETSKPPSSRHKLLKTDHIAAPAKPHEVLLSKAVARPLYSTPIRRRTHELAWSNGRTVHRSSTGYRAPITRDRALPGNASVDSAARIDAERLVEVAP